MTPSACAEHTPVTPQLMIASGVRLQLMRIAKVSSDDLVDLLFRHLLDAGGDAQNRSGANDAEGDAAIAALRIREHLLELGDVSLARVFTIQREDSIADAKSRQGGRTFRNDGLDHDAPARFGELETDVGSTGEHGANLLLTFTCGSSALHELVRGNGTARYDAESDEGDEPTKSIASELFEHELQTDR